MSSGAARGGRNRATHARRSRDGCERKDAFVAACRVRGRALAATTSVGGTSKRAATTPVRIRSGSRRARWVISCVSTTTRAQRPIRRRRREEKRLLAMLRPLALKSCSRPPVAVRRRALAVCDTLGAVVQRYPALHVVGAKRRSGAGTHQPRSAADMPNNQRRKRICATLKTRCVASPRPDQRPNVSLRGATVASAAVNGSTALFLLLTATHQCATWERVR